MSDFDLIYAYAKQLLHLKGKPDASGYTGNRKVLWIDRQPRFGKKFEVVSGHEDKFITYTAKQIYPTCNFILVAGGDTNIGMHRDATFASPIAMSLSLGGTANFIHEDVEAVTKLKHGDVTSFNCKKLHSITDAEKDRIVIVMWEQNPKWVT